MRKYESGLLLMVAGAIAVAALYTWADVQSDRRTTLEADAAVTDALAASLGNHIDAGLRDAANAALSAALLVEQAGGPRALGEERLHRELKRELWNDETTARLVLLAADGSVIASSTEFPHRVARVERPPAEWPMKTSSPRAFRIAAAQRSPFGGELVLPYSCDVLGPNGAVVGTVRAEVNVGYFASAWASIGIVDPSVAFLATVDGILLARAPLREQMLGPQPLNTRRFIQDQIGDMPKGHVEATSPGDGITRLYSWRRMGEQPFFVAVGNSKYAALAQWRERTWRRGMVLAAGSAALLALALALASRLRRLQASEESRREAELRLSTAIESSTIAVALTDAQGQFIHFNSAAEKMFGYTREELLAQPPGALLTPESAKGRAERLRNMTTRDSYQYEITMTRKDGRVIWVSVNTSRVRDLKGATSGYVVHTQDITERREQEARILALNEQLEQRVQQRTAELLRANRDLEAFSYSAAHDIRSPLAALDGYVERLALDLGNAPDKIARRVESIKRQIRHMMQTVEDLLALSRSGHQPLRLGLVDMFGLAAQVCEQLDAQAGERPVRWVVKPMPEVWADRGSLREALANLLGNALKYTEGREPAIIEIGCSREDGVEAEFYVKDNGIGFDPAQAGSLFIPFRRLPSAARFQGTGVGLAIVQRILERNGGRIWAEGTPGEGAVFRFTLPAAEPAQAQPMPVPSVEEAAGNRV